MTSFLRILPGMLAAGTLTGKAVGHHLPTLMPANTTPLWLGPPLFWLLLLHYTLLWWYKTQAVPKLYKGIIELLIMIWTFVFCLLKKTSWVLLGLLPVSLGIPCELGMSMITGNRRGQRLHPWPLTLFHHCLF